jgi:hypothetical protein
LASLQDEDFNVNLLGFEDEELARLLAAQDAAEGLTDEDSVPELPDNPVTVLDDVWLCGKHRVLCRDATNRDAIEKILCDGLADLRPAVFGIVHGQNGTEADD